MADLDFINDGKLRNILENSIEYIYALYDRSKSAGQEQLYKEETYRVIILYVISAIEAMLLYFYKERGEKIEYFEYKFAEQLSEKYICKEKDNLPVVIAAREKIEKKDHQIGLYDLITFFLSKKLIQQKTADDILELNDVRNTFHLSKPRVKSCDIERVELALKLLVHTIEKAPLALKIKQSSQNA